MIDSQRAGIWQSDVVSISKGIGDRFPAPGPAVPSHDTVYQRGLVIDSQLTRLAIQRDRSISKGIGD